MNKLKDTLIKSWLSLFATTSHTLIEKEKPLLEQVELLVDIVDVDFFSSYTSSIGQGTTVETFYNYFSEYVEEIEAHITSMQDCKPIIASRCRSRAVIMPINKFFISPEGFYVNVHDNVLAYRDAVKRLCNQLRGCIKESSAIGNYNLRLLTPLLDNVRVILSTLIELSETQS